MKQTLIALSATFALFGCSQGSDPVAGGSQAGCATRAYAEIGGPISMIDHTGAAVTEADFKVDNSLIFFGFANCPDICPTTLVTIDRALQRLPEDIEPPRTLLVTVDPERDTPEVLATYISSNAFPDKISGLTGSPEQIEAAALAFRAGYQKVETPESLAEYTMDHTSLVYLMDEDWSLKTFFTHDATDADIAVCLEELLG